MPLFSRVVSQGLMIHVLIHVLCWGSHYPCSQSWVIKALCVCCSQCPSFASSLLSRSHFLLFNILFSLFLFHSLSPMHSSPICTSVFVFCTCGHTVYCSEIQQEGCRWRKKDVLIAVWHITSLRTSVCLSNWIGDYAAARTSCPQYGDLTSASVTLPVWPWRHHS